jgi:hypothetical protein
MRIGWTQYLNKIGSHLNGGDVGVDDDSVDTLLLERLDGLGAGVVKLPRLPDGQAPRTQDQHLRTKHICASEGTRRESTEI